RDRASTDRVYSSCIEPLGRCIQSGTSGFAPARADWQPSARPAATRSEPRLDLRRPAFAPGAPKLGASAMSGARGRRRDDTLLLQLLEHLLHGIRSERRFGHLHVLLERV